MPQLRLVPFGPPAAAALRDAIAAAKGGDALAPVTVAVPSNYAGLSLRRALGRDGLVNVRFLVLPRVAELLGAPALAAQGRRPLTSPVRAESVRAALAEGAEVFRDVAAHAATERALEQTFRELRQSSPDALDAVATRSPRASEVVRLYRDARRRTEAYYDEEDLAEAAAAAVRDGTPALRDVGHVVLHLPRRLSPAQRALVEALAAAGRCTAVLGLTGDAHGDAPARSLAATLERALGPAEEQPPGEAPAATQIVAVTDAEEEVRTALRSISERLRAGTPLYRMAVLYPAAQPYALLADEQFRAAGVPHNGPAVRTLAQTLAGRTLLGLLRLHEADFRREAVLDWLSAAPVLEQPAGDPTPAHRWDVLSRGAGVVRGATQWRDRLGRHARLLRERLAALERKDERPAWESARLEADLRHTQRLAAFVEELAARADPGRRSSWAEFAAWARELLERYLGGEGRQAAWPPEETEAYRSVDGALEALANLDDVRPRTDETTFRRALERELDAPAARVGRFGHGVFAGRIADALGTDFDAVFILGMTEGLLPPRARDDPLLPDRERAAAGEGMPLRTDRAAEQRRDYLAALASAPERILVFPRADLRGQRGHLPARWLLETASRLEGRPVYSSDVEELRRPWYSVVASFQAALEGSGEPASEQEYDLRSLLGWRRAGADVLDHALATGALRAGLQGDLARQSARLTRWDGFLRDAQGLAPSAERAVSPTALQHWATCPFRYFLGQVLRVAETERPEEALELSPIDRGNLVHRALEEFISHAPPRSSPGQPWSGEERALLRRTGERLCADAEAAGITGRALLWRLQREQILRDLDGFLDHDEELRAQLDVVPGEVELSFGLADSERPPLIVTLADGRNVAFRGRIDRVDGAPDGRRVVVLDYKSGSAYGYEQLDKDPVRGGRLLQLPVYGLAAQGAAGDVRAYYWFVSEQRDYARHGYPLTDETLGRFRDALGVIVDGIGAGVFPARPGKHDQDGFDNCRFCPYDRVCPRERGRIWKSKRWAPQLRAYLDLAEPEG